MTKIKALPSVTADLFEILPEELLEYFLPKVNASDSITLTFYAEGKIIAIAGISGVKAISMGEAWMVPTPEFYQYPLAARTMREELRQAEKELGFTRYQMTTKTKEPKHRRFARWLGYTYEATLEAYANGESYDMFKRILWPQPQQ